MCKTRFGSQGVILDGFQAKKKFEEKNVNVLEKAGLAKDLDMKSTFP